MSGEAAGKFFAPHSSRLTVALGRKEISSVLPVNSLLGTHNVFLLPVSSVPSLTAFLSSYPSSYPEENLDLVFLLQCLLS